MKLFFLSLGTCFLIGTGLLSSCKTSKDTMNTESNMILLLKKKQDANYIETAYAAYQPSNIRKINRTLNQYQVSFKYMKKEEAQLLEALKADENIIEYTYANQPQKGTKVQSSTNDKHAKVKPGNKN